MKLAVALSAFAVILPAAAFAQEQAEKDGIYIRLGGGATFVSDWAQDYTYNPNTVFVTPPPAGQTVSNGSGFLLGGAIGFDYADGIRTELEYRYAVSKIDGAAIDGVPATVLEDDMRAHFIFSNFFFDLTNASPLTPFIGGGVGGAFVDNENGVRDAALAYQGRAGVSLALSDGFSLDTEYIYVGSNKLVYGPTDEEFTPTGPAGPRIDGERYQSSSVMMTIRKEF